MKYVKSILTLVIWLVLLKYSYNALIENAIQVSNLVTVIPLVSILYLINNFIRSEFINAIYLSCGFRIKRLHSFLSVFIASSLNFIVPFKIGTLYRAIYLKNVHNFNYEFFVSGNIGFTVYSTIATLILTIITLLWIGFSYDEWDILLMLVLISILILVLFMLEIAKRTRINIKYAYIGNFIDKMSNGLSRIFHNRRLLITALVSIISLTLSNGLALYIVLDTMEADTGFISLILLALTQTLAGMLSITPGAVGIQEAAGLLIHEIIAIPADKVVLAVFSIRLIKILTISLLIYPAHQFLIKNQETGK